MAFTVVDGRTVSIIIARAILCRIAAVQATTTVGDPNLDSDGDTTITVTGPQQVALLAKSNLFVSWAKTIVNGGTIAAGQYAGTYPGW